jgi:Bacterial DNA topoisomerase IB, N-terminal domain
VRTTLPLSRSDLSAAGIGRKRSGPGFRYTGPGGGPVKDPQVLARIKDLVIPPAWEDVWICPDPRGSAWPRSAVSTSSAGVTRSSLNTPLRGPSGANRPSPTNRCARWSGAAPGRALVAAAEAGAGQQDLPERVPCAAVVGGMLSLLGRGAHQ